MDLISYISDDESTNHEVVPLMDTCSPGGSFDSASDRPYSGIELLLSFPLSNLVATV